MNCPAADVLQAFLMGRVSADDGNRLAAHVENCEQCVSALDHMHGSDPIVAALQTRRSMLDETSLGLAGLLMTKLVVLRPESVSDPAEQATCADNGPTETDHDPLHLLAPAQNADELGRL